MDAVKSANELGEIITRRFGDEQSSLLDQFERKSFEIHLSKAILARSLSEPSTMVRASARLQQQQQPPTLVLPMLSQPSQGLRGKSSFHKLLNKFVKPFLGGRKRKQVSADPKDTMSNWKAFSSRSMRL